MAVGHPGLHRDPGRHAPLPWCQPVRGQVRHVPVPKDFQFIGAGYLPEIGPDTGYNNLTVLLGLVAIALLSWGQMRSRAKLAKINAEVPPMWVTITRIVGLALVLLYVTYLFATGRPGTSFPVPGLILVALVILYTFIADRTVIGRHIYAVGGNRNAAELSGVRSRRVYFLVMMNMAVLSALAGMIFVARSTASGPFDGVGWELDAIAAVFIGGAAVSGGVGTVVGSMIGGLIMAVLNNGHQLWCWSRRHPDDQGHGPPTRRGCGRHQQDPRASLVDRLPDSKP